MPRGLSCLLPPLHRALNATELRDLAACFREGTAAVIARGDYPGVILAATLHPWLNAVAATLGPHPLRWQGKTFGEDTGENLWLHHTDPAGVFLAGVSRLIRWQARQHSGDLYRAVPFRASSGPSVADERHQVLRISYNVAANPPFIRRIRDELVDLGNGQYLGRGYYRLWGRWFPWVWFMLAADGSSHAMTGTNDANGLNQ